MLPHPAAAAQVEREEAEVRVLGDDTFATGSRVRLVQDSAGDVIAAGGDLSLTGRVGGDAVAVGRELALRSTVDGDVYAAGGELRIEGMVAGNARVAGGRVELDAAGEVAGNMSAAGRYVRIDGRVGRYLQVAAREARIDGRVGGDVEVTGGELQIGPQAVINGMLIFRGPRPPDVEPGAQVLGGVRHVQRSDAGEDLADKMGLAIGVGALLWLLGWFIAGSILLAACPLLTRSLTLAVRSRPWWSVLGGLLLLVGVPILILILMVTVIGIPLGLVLLALYLVWMPLGFLIAAATLGDWLLSRLRRGRETSTGLRILAFAGGLIVLGAVACIPIVGQIAVFLAWLAGMGSIVTAFAHRRASTQLPPVA
jgi:cytoskeletal protein CcmA (bactofilin family)